MIGVECVLVLVLVFIDIMNDKEKIKVALKSLNGLKKNIELWKEGVESGYTQYSKREYVEAVLDTTLYHFSNIKKTLES